MLHVNRYLRFILEQPNDCFSARLVQKGDAKHYCHSVVAIAKVIAIDSTDSRQYNHSLGDIHSQLSLNKERRKGIELLLKILCSQDWDCSRTRGIACIQDKVDASVHLLQSIKAIGVGLSGRINVWRLWRYGTRKIASNHAIVELGERKNVAANFIASSSHKAIGRALSSEKRRKTGSEIHP